MAKIIESWVIYLMNLKKLPTGMKAVCPQSEWDAMELARPGYHQLVQTGIGSEAEAEVLARGEPAEAPARSRTKKAWQVRQAQSFGNLPKI